MSAAFIRDLDQQKRELAALMAAVLAQSNTIDQLKARIEALETKRPGRPPNGQRQDHQRN